MQLINQAASPMSLCCAWIRFMGIVFYMTEKITIVLPSFVYIFDNRAGKITIKMFNPSSLVVFAGHRPQSVLWDSLTADAVWRFHCWLKIINNDHIFFDVWWTAPSITENLFAMRYLLRFLTNSLLANSKRPNGNSFAQTHVCFQPSAFSLGWRSCAGYLQFSSCY